MIANDINEIRREFFPDAEKRSFGSIMWRTTKSGIGKPSYGTKAEDYPVTTVLLPLVTDEDIEYRVKEFYISDSGKSKTKGSKKKHLDHETEVMARLVKSAYKQGGLLTGAELSVLLNRSLTTIGKYMARYHAVYEQK